MDFESPYHVPVYMQSIWPHVHFVYMQSNMATCSFNARHIIPKPEMDQHIEICPDKDFDINFVEAQSEISVVPTSYEKLYFGDEEDWDEEARNNTQGLPMVRGRRRQKRNEINSFPSMYEAEALPCMDFDINFVEAQSEISVVPTSYEKLYFGDEEDWDEEARNNTQGLPMVRGRRRQKRNEINSFPSMYEAEALPCMKLKLYI
uniref:uncharacterized protein LOC104266237 n=1 Tax=Ciona intestinalis TaxID=7719 RepID=UPI0005218E56|nr:uncharacterized protein LOC104266237 [Ciona intestinalis]|eukprot:XP_009860249.1 uncharacterized protein LOC104266237 [Ciona intestinalis]